jgi:hypothetical protein
VNQAADANSKKSCRVYEIFVSDCQLKSTEKEESLGPVHTNQSIGDQSEVDEKHEYHVEFIES